MLLIVRSSNRIDNFIVDFIKSVLNSKYHGRYCHGVIQSLKVITKCHRSYPFNFKLPLNLADIIFLCVSG